MKKLKDFRIVKGESKLAEILEEEGTFVEGIDGCEVYNYCAQTIIKYGGKIRIGATSLVGVNYVSLQLKEKGIELEEI